MALNTVMPISNKKVVPTEGEKQHDAVNSSLQTKLLHIVDNKSFNALMTGVLIYALFGDDIRLSLCPQSMDNFFYGLSTIALVLFTIEIVVASIAKPQEYRFKFYFWLDILATVSLIPDIGWIWDNLVESMSFLSGSATETILDGAKASRNGAKVGRVVRIVRLVRLVRIVKLFKQVHNDEDTNVKDEPSNVGKVLSELTTRRVILMVLTMLIILPTFDGGVDQDTNIIQEYGLVQLTEYQVSTNVGLDVMENMVKMYSTDALPIYASLCKTSCLTSCEDATTCNGTKVEEGMLEGWLQRDGYYKSPDLISQELRPSAEFEIVEVSCSDEIPKSTECKSVAYFSNKELSQVEATMNMLKTIFIMALLGGISIMFNRDAERLVIRPISRMVNVVRQLAANPLNRNLTIGDKNEETSYETKLLETTLSKIGMLLSIGFGAAGAEIISKNLANGGHLDAMVQGKKVTGIFGFCDIRQFTDTTECLQEEVMVFVNRIGEIVHGATHQFSGAANKNIGDAFLLVWKLSANPETPEAWKSDNDVIQMIDNALSAFIKIHVDTEISNANGVLSTYGVHPSVVKRFGPGYKVRMGYGLHIGWAIEGAIGTEFKIDASYLSAHVGMSGKLEESTKEYGVPLLLSGDFCELLSPAAKSMTRLLDCVKIAGKKYDFYTFEITNIPKSIGEPGDSVEKLDYANDPNVKYLQNDIDPGFKPVFEKGVHEYLEGNWTAAKATIESSLKLKPNDGPSNSLLRFMESHEFTSPADWDGSREI